MDGQTLLWSGLGFLCLTFGNALGAVHMFRGNVPSVMLGVGLMFGGYQMIHYGIHSKGMVVLRSNGQPDETLRGAIRNWVGPVFLLGIAIYCIAQGFVIGAQAAIHSFTIVNMGATGALIVGGYMTGHMAVHGVPL